VDFDWGDQGREFRERVRAFLSDALPPGWTGLGAIEDKGAAHEFVAKWRQTLYRNGLLGITWPTEYGGAGLTRLEQVILAEEFARAGVPTSGASDLSGIKLLGNTLLHWGTDEQKQYFLPRILSGEDVWCQGYSEPGAGSDLAGLSTRAVRNGDRWVINGQKVWTSWAEQANWIFVLARTGPEGGHKGISFLLVPMDQPGVTVRPIRMMSGEEGFNEVFFDDAVTRADHVVGAVGDGWRVAMTLLGYERGEEAATNPILFREELDRLIALARERRLSTDPVVRQELAGLYTRCEIMRFLGYRTLTSVFADETPGAETSIAKLYWSEYHRDAARIAVRYLGPAGTVVRGRLPVRHYRTDDVGAPISSGSWLGTLYASVCGTIYAGTSEVQRNLLAERVLGLPREPAR
jgi:alkylation response protein AidB-like acyl-CoA dehydrogenase